MTKKLLYAGTFVGAFVLLSGCTQQQAAIPTPPAQQTEVQVMHEYEKIADAMKNGKSVRCVMSKKDTQETMMYAVKGKKVKVSGMAGYEGGGTGSMLMDEKYLYTWSDDKKEGVKFEIPAEIEGQPTPTKTQAVPNLATAEDQKYYEDMGYTVSCTQQDVADSEFVPPTDVTFMDTSALMKQAAEMQQGANQEDVDPAKMMEQYKNMMPTEN